MPLHTFERGVTNELPEDGAHDTANIRVHRRRQARWTERRRTGRTSLAGADAIMWTNSMASLPQRPPVSIATTTRQHRLLATSSADFASLSLLARTRMAPFECAAHGWRRPSTEVALRSVTSTDNWAPWCSGNLDATTSMVRWSPAGTTTFMSLNLTFTRTVAPASQHTRARMRSGAVALLRSRPERGHAARCRPSGSKRAPHSQLASVTWSGRRNLSNVKTRKTSGSKRNSGPVGQPRSTAPALGPEYERMWAWSAADDCARTTLFRKWCSEEEAAWYCQPCCHSPDSARSVGGGRAPSLSAIHVGLITNPSRSNWRVPPSTRPRNRPWRGHPPTGPAQALPHWADVVKSCTTHRPKTPRRLRA